MITGTGVHDRPESAFTIDWNECSRSTGIGVHDPPDRARWIKTNIITCDDDNEKHVGIAAGTEYVCLPTDSKLVLCRLWPHLYATELDGIRIFGRNTDAELCRLANVSGLIRQLGGLGSGFTPLFVAPSDHYSSGHGQVSYNRYGVDPHDTTSSMYASQYDFPR